MATQYYWIGSNGPFEYDDTDVYPDATSSTSPMPLTAITLEGARFQQVYLDDAPSVANHAARLTELLSWGIKKVSVGSISDPSTELNVLAGTVAGDLILAYRIQASAADAYTIYAWDTSPTGSENVPYTVDGADGGRWMAIAGRYFASGLDIPTGANYNIAGVPHTHDYVVGPASAISNNFAAFDGITGDLIKDSGSKAADFAIAAHDHSGTSSSAFQLDNDSSGVKVKNIGGTTLYAVNAAEDAFVDFAALNVFCTASFFLSSPYAIFANLIDRPELVKFTSTSTAVNELTFGNSDTAGYPSISATGSDTNIGIDLLPKGNDSVRIVKSDGTYALYTRGGNIDIGRDNEVGINLRAFATTDADGPHIRGYRCDGTEASPVSVDTGDNLLRLHAYGYVDDAGYEGQYESSRIEFNALEDFTAGVGGQTTGSAILFKVCTAGTTAGTLNTLLELRGASLAFFASTPVVQQSHIANPTDLGTCQTAIASILTALENYGLLKTS